MSFKRGSTRTPFTSSTQDYNLVMSTDAYKFVKFCIRLETRVLQEFLRSQSRVADLYMCQIQRELSAPGMAVPRSGSLAEVLLASFGILVFLE